MFRQLHAMSPCGPFLGDDAHDLRDYIAGTAQHDRIANTNVLALELVDVVQRGVRYGRTADKYGIETCDGRERACAADLPLDCPHPRHLFLCRKLVRDGPARRTRDKAKLRCWSSESTL
jgi:hypothetical protein